MSPALLDQAFGIAGQIAIAGWASLLFLPRWRGISRVVAGVLAPAALSLGYTVLIFAFWHGSPGGFGSLDEVAALFGSKPLLLAGWVHYLAFDLLIGNLILRRSQAEGVPHLVMVPILIATFLFGPMGYLAWLGVSRTWAAGRLPERALTALPARLPLPDALRGLRLDPVLGAAALASLLLMLPTALAHALDPRLFQGVGVWIKPLKFQASFVLFFGTLALILPLASDAFRRGPGGWFVRWGAIVPAFLEIAYIGWRASRAEASHYGVDTPFGAAAYTAMGIGAVILTAAAPVLAWGLMRRDAAPLPRPLRLSLVAGLVLTFALGVWSGLYMGSNPGGHFVGTVPESHATLPLIGWSLAIGDLRVAHFLALHAMQIVPLLGLLAWWALRERATAAVWTGTAAYVALTLGAFWTATQARPLLALG